MASRTKLLRWIGVLTPLAFTLMALITEGALSQPWSHPAVDVLIMLPFFTFFIVSPYLVAFVCLLITRPGGPVWWTALGYTILVGVFGVAVSVSVLTDDSSTAAIGLALAPMYQLLGLAPAALLAWLLSAGLTSSRARPAGAR